MAPSTPAGLVIAPGRSHRFMYRIVWPFRLQPPPVAPIVWLAFATGRTFGHGPIAGPPTGQGSARRHLGFAMDSLARRDDRPNRVRHPPDWSFTSRCSPPPLAGTQVRSITKAKPDPDRDFHPAGSIHLRWLESANRFPPFEFDKRRFRQPVRYPLDPHSCCR